MTLQTINLDRLLKLRLVVARFGEMDKAKWWNSTGQLAKHGATQLYRGFPRTHYFARARSAFSIAVHRCSEVFDSPDSVTLWQMPQGVEEEFDMRWEHWLERASEWASFFGKIERAPMTDVASTLCSLELVSESDVKIYNKLRHLPQGQAVALPGVFSATDDDCSLLSMGFGKGKSGSLVVPYLRLR